jgi:hypothetical protein
MQSTTTRNPAVIGALCFGTGLIVGYMIGGRTSTPKAPPPTDDGGKSKEIVALFDKNGDGRIHVSELDSQRERKDWMKNARGWEDDGAWDARELAEADRYHSLALQSDEVWGTALLKHSAQFQYPISGSRILQTCIDDAAFCSGILRRDSQFASRSFDSFASLWQSFTSE